MKRGDVCPVHPPTLVWLSAWHIAGTKPVMKKKWAKNWDPGEKFYKGLVINSSQQPKERVLLLTAKPMPTVTQSVEVELSPSSGFFLWLTWQTLRQHHAPLAGCVYMPKKSTHTHMWARSIFFFLKASSFVPRIQFNLSPPLF